MRLWVEMPSRLNIAYQRFRQPPCEAVSWNFLILRITSCMIVSLLVRLWVEIDTPSIIFSPGFPSASLWGCELKFQINLENILCQMSASLWGCELKFLSGSKTLTGWRQPPCEAVSWNLLLLFQVPDFLQSASLWGCELKYIVASSRLLSWCQPPCEAVSWNWRRNRTMEEKSGQPPCEAVSWNTIITIFSFHIFGQPPCEAVSWNWW